MSSLSNHKTELFFVALGVVVPYVLTLVGFVVRALIYRYRINDSPRAALIGTWYAFHYSTINHAAVVRREVWKIRVDMRGSLVARAVDPKMATLEYVGTVVAVDSGQWVCAMRGVRHHEESYLRFPTPIPSGQDQLFGIEVAVDFDRRIRATIWLLSRVDLSEDVASDLLTARSEYSYDKNSRSLTLMESRPPSPANVHEPK